jgi:hypothetical protein
MGLVHLSTFRAERQADAGLACGALTEWIRVAAACLRPICSVTSAVVRNLPPLAAALGLLALLSLGELRLFDRLLYHDAEQFGFVLVGVDGVLAGTPVSKSWQHRVLPAGAVRAVQRIVGHPLGGLKWFAWSMLIAANIWLFWIARRRDNSPRAALAIVAAFGLVHLLLLYKLEYPWDEVDVLIFLAFGHCVAQRIGLLRLWPLLVVGSINHETILYLPLWFLLAPLDSPLNTSDRRDAWLALVVLALLIASVLALRAWLYVGRPALPAQFFEIETPGINNHLHVRHNLRQWFVEDWRDTKIFISTGLSAAVLFLATRLVRRGSRRIAAWSLISLASVVCFGYVNETRHYLPLVAFYFAYLCPRLSKPPIPER